MILCDASTMPIIQLYVTPLPARDRYITVWPLEYVRVCCFGCVVVIPDLYGNAYNGGVRITRGFRRFGVQLVPLDAFKT